MGRINKAYMPVSSMSDNAPDDVTEKATNRTIRYNNYDMAQRHRPMAGERSIFRCTTFSPEEPGYSGDRRSRPVS